MAAASGEANVPKAAKGANIWLLTMGALGDHKPFSALAAGLERAGHKVKSFGLSYCKRTFTDFGLDFEPINTPVALHRRNTEVRSAIRKAAAEVGIEGPHQEEDYLLRALVLKTELTLSKCLHLMISGEPGQNIKKVLVEDFARFDSFIELGGLKDLDDFVLYVEEASEQCLKWHAIQTGLELKDCKALRSLRILRFIAHMRSVAESMGWSTMDIMEVLFLIVWSRIAARSVGTHPEDGDLAKDVAAEMGYCLEFLGDIDLTQYWNRWLERCPDILGETVMTKNMNEKTTYIAMHNVFMTMEATPPEERPQLCVFTIHAGSVAFALQEKYGVRAVIAYPGVLELHRHLHMATFAAYTHEEAKEGTPCTPLTNTNPIAFSHWMTSGRQLSAMSPTRFTDKEMPADVKRNKELQDFWRSRCTGTWLHEASEIPSDDVRYFESPEEKEKVANFLAASKERPICMSFGSMVHPEGPVFFAKLLVKAVMLVQRRFVFLSGLSGITPMVLQEALSSEEKNHDNRRELTNRICWLRVAPHDWLLSHCVLMVQHGGAGTISTAMLAGVPSLVVPSGHEQNGHAMFLRKLGIGMETSMLKSLTFGELGNKMRTMVQDQGMMAKAREVAKAMKAERGVARAVELIEGFLSEEGGDEFVDPSGMGPPFPWLDGRWGIYDKGGIRIASNVHITGNKATMNEQDFLWMRWGAFKQGDRQYNAEVYRPGQKGTAGVMMASVSDSGTSFILEDGLSYLYEGVVEEEENRKAKAAISTWASWAARPD